MEQWAKAAYPGSMQFILTFFFELSKVNALKINLMKIFLIYASLNHIRILQCQLLIYAPVNYIRILQRQFDDDSCFPMYKTWQSEYIKRIDLIYFHRKYTLSNYQTVRLPDCQTVGLLDRRTIRMSDYRLDSPWAT